MAVIMMDYEGATYYFNRDSTGEGGWVCVSGRAMGSTGGTPCHTYVHLELNNILTDLAVERNLGEQKYFSRYIKKEKLVQVIHPKKNRKSAGLFGGVGLSLSSIFDNINTEEKHKITEVEEISADVYS